VTKTLKVVGSVASVSFREIVRDKILYNILVIAVLLLGLGFLASRLTFVRPDRVILDFGVSAVGLSTVAIATFIGASLLNREIERRTMFLALSRPISRHQFIVGKFVGLLGVLVLNWFLVSGVFLSVLLLSGGVEAGSFTPTLFVALLLLLFQSMMMASVAIFFSTVSTTSLSSVLAVGIYLIGNNVSQIQNIAMKMHSKLAAWALDFLGFIIPNLEHFTLGTQVTYGIPIPARFVWFAIGYGLVVSATLITLSGVLIQKKEA
jgi:Cu-processing system permease protein